MEIPNETCENTVEEINLEPTLLLNRAHNDQEEEQDDDDDVPLLSNHNNQGAIIRQSSILTKERILIGSNIALLLIIILLIISIKIPNHLSSSDSQSSTISHTATTETLTFSPSITIPNHLSSSDSQSSTISHTPTTETLTFSPSITIPNHLSSSDSQPSTISHTPTTETLTFSPESCPISSENATWNTPGSVFINRLNRCVANENGLCNPQDLFIDNIHHTLYVADTKNNRIQKYSLNEIYNSQVGATGITVANHNLVLPQSVFVDVHTEDMYILDFDQKPIRNPANTVSYRVHLWKKNENVGRILFSEAGEFLFGQYFHHIRLDQHMNIYIGTRFFIKKWFASTSYAEKVIVAGKNQFNGHQSADLWDPGAFVVNDDLTVYIADWQNKRIQQWKINATEGTTLVRNLTYVMGMTIDCNGYLYFVDTYEHTISQLNMVTNETRIIVSFENDEKKSVYHLPSMIKIDPFGNLFVLDGDQVYKFSIGQK